MPPRYTLPTKICTACGRNLSVEEFYTIPSRGNQVLSQCKPCLRAIQKAWRQTERARELKKAETKRERASEAYRQRLKKTQANPQWRENRRTYLKAYRDANKESAKEYQSTLRANRTEQDRQRIREYANARAKTPKGRANLNRHKHVRRMAFAGTAVAGLRLLTMQEWESIKVMFDHRCAYCRREARLTMDHVIPVSKGGLHTADNVVPACRSCNAKKGNRMWIRPEPSWEESHASA